MPDFPGIFAAENTGIHPAPGESDQKILLFGRNIVPPGQACQRTDGLALHFRAYLNAYTVRFELPIRGIHVLCFNSEPEILVVPVPCLIQTSKDLNLNTCFIR
jgi:hypothetical protein